VDSLAMREVSKAQLNSAHPTGSAYPQDMFRLDWQPVPLPDPAPTATARWAVLGADELGLGDALKARRLTGLDAPGDGPVPDVVLVPCLGGLDGTKAAPEHLAARTLELTGEVLALLQRWLADARYASSRLVLVTRGAVTAGDPQGP